MKKFFLLATLTYAFATELTAANASLRHQNLGATHTPPMTPPDNNQSKSPPRIAKKAARPAQKRTAMPNPPKPPQFYIPKLEDAIARMITLHDKMANTNNTAHLRALCNLVQRNFFESKRLIDFIEKFVTLVNEEETAFAEYADLLELFVKFNVTNNTRATIDQGFIKLYGRERELTNLIRAEIEQLIQVHEQF